MKKFIPVFLVIMSIFVLGGCGGGGGEPTNSLNGIWYMESGKGEITVAGVISAVTLDNGTMTIAVVTDDYDKPTCNISSYTQWTGPQGTFMLSTPSESAQVIRTGNDSFTFTTKDGQTDFDTNGNFKSSGNFTQNNIVYSYTLVYKGHKR